jgi:hypothetical protein
MSWRMEVCEVWRLALEGIEMRKKWGEVGELYTGGR